jgi:uncharacterized protein (TIRG00374 family)
MIMAANPQTSRRLYRWVIYKLAPLPFQEKALSLADRFMEGLSSLTSFKDILMVFFTSVIIWLLETVKYWFVMFAFNFTVSFFALMLMNGVVNLATTLPSAPGYIGTFDGPGIEVLKVFGVAPEVAAAYTLVLHAALWLPITALGVYYMVMESLNWKDFGKAVKTGQLAKEGEDRSLAETERDQTSPEPVTKGSEADSSLADSPAR